VFGWYSELDTTQKEALVAYVITLLWNLPLGSGKNTEDLAYDTWWPNTSKQGRQCLQDTSMPVRHKEQYRQFIANI
jgi:hypothetical protein